MNLAVFTDASLAYSLTTTVWIGVCILCLGNLGWGFALSGLIVPGILVPLSMAFPVTGGLIVTEALVTLGLTRLLSQLLPSLGLGSKLFGRDRFFLILLLSIITRIGLEGAALPLFLQSLAPDSPQLLDLQNSTSAFGLILVPLLANQLWKPGLKRGFIALALVNGLTYLVIRYVLLPYTNFNFTALALQFETASQYLPDSPKSYIILMTTVYLASRFNLNYGWDFSGIVFPGLIALALFDPFKIFVTVCETLVIALLATLLMQIKAIRESAMSGAKQVLFFFTIAFVYKLILSQSLTRLLGTDAIDDFMGLGYVMSSVFAMKICRYKPYAFHLSAGLAQVSVAGCLLGLAISHGFTLFKPELQLATPSLPPLLAQSSLPAELSLSAALSLSDYIKLVSAARPSFFAPEASQAYRAPSKSELDRFIIQVAKPLIQLSQTLSERHLSLDLRTRNPGDLYRSLQLIKGSARTFGFDLAIVQEPSHGSVSRPPVAILLEDGAENESRHWGLFAVTLGPAEALGVIVGKPLLASKTLEFGLWSFDRWNASYFIAPLAHPLANHDGSADLTHPANRTNLINALLIAIGRESKSLKPTFVELLSSADRERSWAADEALQIYPSLERNAPEAVTKLRKFFSERNVSLASDKALPPSHSFQTNLKVGDLPFYALALPFWIRERMRPLQGISTWEKNWLTLGRPKIKVDTAYALAHRQDEPSPLSRLVRAEFDRYFQSADPLPLLRFERAHASLHFELLEDPGHQYLAAYQGRTMLYDVQILSGVSPPIRPLKQDEPLQTASRARSTYR